MDQSKTPANSLGYNYLVSSLFSTDQPTIPFDVTYRIHDKEDQFQGEVSAHNYLLGLVSPVFRSSLFGSDNTDKKAKSIEAGTTVKAFKTMIDFIYKRQIDFEQITVHEIFDIVDLAECYMIPELMNLLKERLENVKVTKDNMIEVAKTAEEFKRFKEASKPLITNCTKTLNRELTSRESWINFNLEMVNTGNEVIGVKLMSMMEDLAPICSNCQATPCKSGTDITSISQVKVGTVIAPGPGCSQLYGRDDMGETEVTSITGSYMRMYMYVGPGKGNYKYPATQAHPVQMGNGPLFRFSCGQ